MDIGDKLVQNDTRSDVYSDLSLVTQSANLNCASNDIFYSFLDYFGVISNILAY